jgi:hypothetical protein
MKQPQPPYDDAQVSAVVTRHCVDKCYIVDGPEARTSTAISTLRCRSLAEVQGCASPSTVRSSPCPLRRATAGPRSFNTRKTRQRSSQPSWPSWTRMPIPPRVKSRSSDDCAAHGLNCMSATARCCVGEGGARVLLILRRAERTSGHAAGRACDRAHEASVKIQD